MTAVILFDKKDIEDLVAVSGRVPVVQILCVDDPGRHMIRLWATNYGGFRFLKAQVPTCDLHPEAF